MLDGVQIHGRKLALLIVLCCATGTLLADKKKDTRPDAGTVTARVKNVNANSNTLTVLIANKNGEKRGEEKTFTLQPQVRINWVVAKGREPQAAKLADIQPGDAITLYLSPDGKEVQAMDVFLPTLHGSIRSVQAERRIITVSRKDKNADTEQEVVVPKETKILLNDGVSKNEQPKEGSLSDLVEGLVVSVHLDKDRRTAQTMHVHGPTVRGTIRGYDAGTRTLTIQVKEDGQLVEKSYRLAGNARIEGELSVGETVHIRLSVFDRATAVAAVVPKK